MKNWMKWFLLGTGAAYIFNMYLFIKFIEYGIRTPGVTWSEGWYLLIIPVVSLVVATILDRKEQKGEL
jgi:uncharacterized membrane protein (DUF106 family)